MAIDEIKFSFGVIDVITTAVKISSALNEECLTCLDFILSAVDYPDAALCNFLVEKNGEDMLLTDAIVQSICDDNDLYEDFIEKYSQKESDTTFVKGVDGKVLEVKLDMNTYDYIYVEFSQELENAIHIANDISKANGVDYVSLDALIYVILSNRSSVARKVLSRFYNVEGMMKALKKELHFKEMNKILIIPEEMKKYVTNLTQKYKNKTECDILERDSEIEQLWNIISKKTKRNAMLLGKPGVGKSAIVEAITCSICNNTCPAIFKNYTVLELNLNSMVAGTIYRGQFEERVAEFTSFIENTKNLIVFIDEIHQIVGAGSTSENSGPDLSGSLKPLLARDNVIFIGATTTDEYERIIQQDGALSRRFETIIVEEPKFDKVKPMLSAKIKNLSKYHGVSISDKMVDDMIIVSGSFYNIANPDRTLDLIDKTMAVVKLSGEKEVKPSHIKKVFKSNYMKLDKQSNEYKKSTAYHEAGHFVAWLLSKTKYNTKCIFISIVPAYWWAGITMYENDDAIKYAGDRVLFRERVAGLLAGRIAQSFISNSFDSGASSDLQKATEIVEKYIMTYGIEEDFLNYSFDTDNTILGISDNMTDNIRKKTMEFIKSVYDETFELLSKNKEGIARVANLLLKKSIISAKEAENAFYLKNKLNANKRKDKESKGSKVILLPFCMLFNICNFFKKIL